jgi:hypothetical protein
MSFTGGNFEEAHPHNLVINKIICVGNGSTPVTSN